MLSMTTLTAGQAENYYDKDDLYHAQGSEISEGRIANTMGFDPEKGIIDEFIDKEKYREMIRENEQFKTVEFELNLSEEFKKTLLDDPQKKEYFNRILEKNLRNQAKKSGLKLQENRFVFSREGILRGATSHNIATAKFKGKYEKLNMHYALGNITKSLKNKPEFSPFKDLITRQNITLKASEMRGRIGLDMTFSVPKSVSLMRFTDSHQKLIESAHYTALDNVLKHINSEYATARKTTDGQQEMVKGNLDMRIFNHELSRNKDPQFHSHVIISNRMKCEDGQIRSIEPKQIFKDQKFLGFTYRTELARELQKSGIEIEITDKKNFYFEVKGVPESLIKEFSTRTNEIEQEWKDRELSADDQRGKKAAALAIRKAKTAVDIDLEKYRWVGEVNALNVSVTAPKEPPVKPTEEVIKVLEKKEFSFTESEFFKHYKELDPYAEIETIKATFREKVAFGEIVKTIVDGQAYYATAGALMREYEIRSLARAGREWSWMTDTVFMTPRMESSLEPLNEGQRAAILTTLKISDRVSAVEGDAGSGKTHMLKSLQEICTDQRIDIRGMAFTGKAVNGMRQESGIECSTIHSFLNRLEREANQGKAVEHGEGIKQEWDLSNIQRNRGKELWVVDEASMLDNNLTRHLFEAARRRDAKVVLIGDRKQLQSLGAGSSFKTLLDNGDVRITRMSEVFRQKDRWHVYGKELLSQADMNAIRETARKGNAVARFYSGRDFMPEQQRGREKISPEIGGRSCDIWVESNLRRAVSNLAGGESVRSSLDLLSENTFEYKSRKDRFNQIKYDFVSGFNTEKMDSVVLVGTNSDRKAMNWKIREELKARGVLQGGITVTVPNRVGRTEKMEIAVNDRIMALENNSKQGVNNGSLFTVEGISKDGQRLTLKGENDLYREVNLQEYNRFTHAYAVTVHKAQGMSVQDVYVNLDTKQKNFAYKNNLYVSLSRAKESLHIYTNDKTEVCSLFDRERKEITAKEFDPFDLDKCIKQASRSFMKDFPDVESLGKGIEEVKNDVGIKLGDSFKM